MGKFFHIVILFSIYVNVVAQYSPPAGQEGSTAIHKDSSLIISWASDCTVERGFMDISYPSAGFVVAGEEGYATGQADGQIVSLGDGGNAILTFDPPIKNGPGPDFAVFENGFTDDFLELAFVEVSSDGINFFRYDAVSLTQTNNQVGSFGVLDATKIHNLAGKFRIDYGVPFNISGLANNPLLNKDSIVMVKVIDVVGCIQEEYARYDSEGNVINDPWPTAFESGGFDLDAVGVINNTSTAGTIEILNPGEIRIYPNPARKQVFIEIDNNINVDKVAIFSEYGLHINISNRQINQVKENKYQIDISTFPAGLYLLKIGLNDQFVLRKFIKQ